MKSGGGKRGGREEENKVAGGERERGGGQKGELVHAMIMVMNHKSHNIAENKLNQNSQTKGKINNNPSHKEHEMLPFPRCIQSIQITMAATRSAPGYGTGDDKTAPAPTEMDPWVRPELRADLSVGCFRSGGLCTQWSVHLSQVRTNKQTIMASGWLALACAVSGATQASPQAVQLGGGPVHHGSHLRKCWDQSR